MTGPTVEVEHEVTEADTAIAVGSGSVPVLGTPVLVAWAEQATLELDQAPDGYASVGTRVEIKHRAPSPVGSHVVVRAELVESDQSRRTFVFSAWHAEDPTVIIGQGLVRRSLVEVQAFLNPPPPLQHPPEQPSADAPSDRS